MTDTQPRGPHPPSVPRPAGPVPEDARRVLWDVAVRGDADLFRDLARFWNVPGAERRRIWRDARAAPRRAPSLVDGGPRNFVAAPWRWWRDLFQPPIPLSWRERRRILLLWLVALLLVAAPITFLWTVLRAYLTLLPLPR